MSEQEEFEVNIELRSLSNYELYCFLDNVSAQVLEILMEREEPVEQELERQKDNPN